MLVIALIWATVAALVVAERRQVFGDARQELLSAQRVLNNHVGRIFESAGTIMVAVDTWLSQASRGPFGSSLEDLAAMVDRMQASADHSLGVRLFNIDGYIVRFGEHGKNGLYAGDREFIQALREREAGAIYIGAPIVTRALQQDVIPIAIKTRPNVFGVFYVVIGIRLEPFRDAFRDYLVTAPGAFGIIRHDGTVLVHVPNELNFTGSRIDGFSLERFVANRGLSGLFEHPGPASGKPRLTAYTVLERQRLVVYASMHIDALNAKWRSNSIDDLLMGLVATLVVVALSAWIVALIRHKERAAARVSQALKAAEAANNAKSDFMARMSHELRTPLNAILGFSEMIADKQFEALAGRFRDYARDIHLSGSHLLGLIDQVLDISKIESRVVELHDEDIALPAFLEECLSSMRPLIEERQLAVAIDVDRDAALLRADRKRVRQMVLNLLSNAVKFNRTGGRIEVHAVRTPSGIDLAVSDTGIGIPDEARAGIFEPFGRGSSEVSRAVDGIGLGLPITKALVELHGGWIEVASIHDQGTTATLHFPARRTPAVRLDEAAAA